MTEYFKWGSCAGHDTGPGDGENRFPTCADLQSASGRREM